MDEDQTLGDFVDSGAEDPNSGTDAESDVDAPLDSGADAAAEPDAPEPAVSTYRWSPDGVACDDCGETVERRWLDGDDYVCAECKEW